MRREEPAAVQFDEHPDRYSEAIPAVGRSSARPF